MEEPSAWTIMKLYELLNHIVDENNKKKIKGGIINNASVILKK